MNADAEFVQFLKDKADEAARYSSEAFEEGRDFRLVAESARRNAFLEALKALGITYEPQSH